MRTSPGRFLTPGWALPAGSILTFVVLGLPDGMLGVAWPSLRESFSQPLAALGELLLALMAGYLVVTTLTGRALRRFGSPAVLAGSAALAAIATSVFLTARWWPTMIGASLMMGAAAGGLDAAVNTVVALAGRARLMNLIHAAFGAGATMGPLVVTAALAVRSSWRGAYGLLWVLQICIVAIWFLARDSLPVFRRDTSPESAHDSPGPPPAQPPAQPAGAPFPGSSAARPVAASPASATIARRANRNLALGLSLTLFFCYTGAELTVASWSATYLTGREHLPVTLAGLAVFAFWAGLTAGRLIPAALGHRLPAQRAAVAGIAGAIAGAAGIWANLSPALCVAALIVTGVGLGPIFPALMTLTPERLGRSAATSAVGWQLAASGIGGSGLSAIAGVVLQSTSLASFGPILILMTVALAALNFTLGLQPPAAGLKGAEPG